MLTGLHAIKVRWATDFRSTQTLRKTGLVAIFFLVLFALVNTRNLITFAALYTRIIPYTKKNSLSTPLHPYQAPILYKRRVSQVADAPGGSGTCQSASCDRLSRLLKRYIISNATIDDHCNTYYEVSCGKFDRNRRLPRGKPSIGMISRLESTYTSKMISLMRHEYQPSRLYKGVMDTQERQNFEKLRRFYNLCIREQTSYGRSRGSLYNLAMDFRDVFPRSGQDFNREELQKIIIWQYNRDIQPIVDVKTKVNVEGGKHARFVTMRTPRFYKFREGTTYEQLRNATVDLLQQVFETPANFTGSDEQDFFTISDNIIQLYKSLREIKEQDKQSGNRSKHIANPDELDRMTPLFSLQDFYKDMVQTNVPKDAETAMNSHEAFRKVHRLLSETPRKILHDYSIWSGMIGKLMLTRSEINLPFRNYLEADMESSVETSCMKAVDKAAEELALSNFIRFYVDPKARNKALQIGYNIRNKYAERASKSRWMSPQYVEQARRKARGMKLNIGFTNRFVDTNFVARYYQNAWISGRSFEQTFQNFLRVKQQAQFGARGPLSPFNWIPGSVKSLGMYMPDQNQVFLSIYALQEPMFSLTYPDYVNYGRMGYILGHEVGHSLEPFGFGFDMNYGSVKKDEGGLSFSYTGELDDTRHSNDKEEVTKRTLKIFGWSFPLPDVPWMRLPPWISRQGGGGGGGGGSYGIRRQYERIANCIKEQLGTFVVRGPGNERVRVRGDRSFRELMSDTVGISTAFDAWKDKTESIGREGNTVIPGFENYSPSQLFFLTNTLSFCEKEDPRALAAQASYGSHPPFTVRFLATYENVHQYFDSFNCNNNRAFCDFW